MKVYLSGPMSGLPQSNFPAFNAAAAALRGLGLQVVNPAEITPIGADTPADDAPEAEHKLYWQKCLRADLAALCDCDAIVTLPGWERSSGAHLEVHVAHRLGLLHTQYDQIIKGGV